MFPIRLLALGLTLTGAALAAPMTYEVKAGDTLVGIARARGLSLDALLDANPTLDPARVLRVGQRLNLGRTTRAQRSETPIVRAASSSGTGWAAPLVGVLTTPFLGSASRHSGVDFSAPRGTLVRAAGSGVVREARFDGRAGWGNTVVIDHGDGLTSRYSHNSALLVRAGQVVRAEQVIARVGSTGNSTGPHLDFRVYKNGVAVNPLAP